MILKENELFQNIDIIDGDTPVGEACIDIKNKILAKLIIYPPCQNKGYGTKAVELINEKYGCKELWVESDNERAIQVYKKNGYEFGEQTVIRMRKE